MVGGGMHACWRRERRRVMRSEAGQAAANSSNTPANPSIWTHPRPGTHGPWPSGACSSGQTADASWLAAEHGRKAAAGGGGRGPGGAAEGGGATIVPSSLCRVRAAQGRSGRAASEVRTAEA